MPGPSRDAVEALEIRHRMLEADSPWRYPRVIYTRGRLHGPIIEREPRVDEPLGWTVYRHDLMRRPGREDQETVALQAGQSMMKISRSPRREERTKGAFH
jgi:hypothetical protein